jgi:hypothetical protein
MSRILFYGVLVIALSTVGCASDAQQGDTSAHRAPQTPASSPPAAPTVEQASPDAPPAKKPVAPVVSPAPVRVLVASGKANPAGTNKGRPVTEPADPATAVDSRSEKLAIELLRLSLEDRIKWKQQQFDNRGIGDVHDHN